MIFKRSSESTNLNEYDGSSNSTYNNNNNSNSLILTNDNANVNVNRNSHSLIMTTTTSSNSASLTDSSSSSSTSSSSSSSSSNLVSLPLRTLSTSISTSALSTKQSPDDDSETERQNITKIQFQIDIEKHLEKIRKHNNHDNDNNKELEEEETLEHDNQNPSNQNNDDCNHSHESLKMNMNISNPKPSTSTSTSTSFLTKLRSSHHHPPRSASASKSKPITHRNKNKKTHLNRYQHIIKTILLSTTLITIIFIFALFAQGISHLLTYRKYFGNAPIPKSPSHGLVVADMTTSMTTADIDRTTTNRINAVYEHGNEHEHEYKHEYKQDEINGSDDNSIQSIQNHNLNSFKYEHNATFKVYQDHTPPYQHSNQQKQHQNPILHQHQSSQSKLPIRLLIIGDSLARGVGQTKYCNPILPQSLALDLSKYLQGAPVYWTTMAEPGASTKWMRHQVLVRSKSNSSGNSSGSNDGISGNSSNGDNDNNKNSNEEEKGKEYTIQGFHDLHSSSRVSVTTSSSTSTSSSSTTSSDDTTTTTSSSNDLKLKWIEKFEYHQKLYQYHPFQNYDIILVMAGLNDIKRILVPFMFHDDQEENVLGKGGKGKKGESEEEKNPNGRNEQGFAADMKGLIQLLNNQHYNQQQQQMQQQIQQQCHDTTPSSSSSSSTTICTNNNKSNAQQQTQTQPPMIVFPRFPTKENPVKMNKLLNSIAIYLSGLIDDIKQRIANQYSNVISPKNSSVETAVLYLQQQHMKREQRRQQKRVEEEEEEDFINNEEFLINLIDSDYETCSNLEYKMKEFYSKRNASDFCIDTPTSSLFAPDGLHPNDSGYDYFGKLLAEDIIKEWGHDRLLPSKYSHDS